MYPLSPAFAGDIVAREPNHPENNRHDRRRFFRGASI